MRDFETWFQTMQESIASWGYYTDFNKVYKNVEEFKDELRLLDTLIGSKNIREEFIALINKNPNVLKAIPILLANRDVQGIKIKDVNSDYLFRFDKPNYSAEEYATFMEKTGLFNLLQNHISGNLIDYVVGVEVGMDTNARKNRTGDVMEDLVEAFLVEYGFKKDQDYFKECTKSFVEQKFGLDLSKISNKGKTEKRFDFVAVKNGHVYGIECNFYSGGGSKLNETARSYKNLAVESAGIGNFTFVWITDGGGWRYAKNNLEETFVKLATIFNLNDLSNGILNQLSNDMIKE